MGSKKILWESIRISLFAVLIAVVVSGMIPSVSIAQEDNINQQLYAGEYELIEIGDGQYEIKMLDPGYSTMESPGDPALPEKIVEFLVPDDIDWSSVEISVEIVESEVLSGYAIVPSPSMKPVFDLEYDPEDEIWGFDKNILNNRNLNVYEVDHNYPLQPVEMLPYTQRKELIQSGPYVTTVGAGIMVPDALVQRNYLRIAYRPFLYNPVKSELTLIKHAVVDIYYDRIVQINNLNIESNGTYDYVIITTNNIVANSERLANFVYLKQLYGHNVKIVTETDYNGLVGQAPNGRAEKIRQWLINNYVTMGIDYVLLIGDPDPDDPTNPTDSIGDLPMKMCWPNYFGYTYRESPTDYFYADLTGDWDLDNDLYFGEALDLTHITSPDAAINEDTFSVRWTGKVMCDFAENYKYHTFSDDGVRLYIDGTLVIDNWTEHLPANDYYTQAMTAGKHDITLEFRENTADGIIQLFYQTTVLKGHAHYVGHQIIPQDHLYDASDNVGGLTGTYYNNPDFTGTSITRKDNTINFIWGTGDKGTGGPDSGAEVFVGRIPVYNNDYDTLDDILGKIIEYETDPGDLSWRKSVLLPMKPLWDDTPSYHLGEGIINDFALGSGLNYYRIYDDDYDPPTPEVWPCTLNDVKGEWASGYGVVVWTTHGSSTGASDVFNSDSASDLDNTKPAFTFQASCLNGYPENNNNLGYALLKHGAIATVSASRVSFDSHGAWTFDPLSGSNHNLAYFYSKRLINDGFPKPAGIALYLTKGNIVNIGMNETDYNLYGEPECYLLLTVPNHMPVADANGPYTANENSAVSFDASGSYDPEGDVLEYRWDFDNNGSWDTAWSASPSASHTWCDNHIGTVKVQVRDELGFTDEATSSVNILNVSPSADAGPDQTVDEGDTVQFNGSFTDPGCDTWTYEWDFGDGSPISTGTLSPIHAYGDNGTYTVTLTVTDDDGGSGTDTLTVTVLNVPPTAFIDSMDQPNPQFILPIVHTLTFNGSFTDPGWLDTHTSLWDFGDETAVSGILTEENLEPDATGTTTAKHIYSEPGIYTVTLTVTDDDGGIGTDTMEVKVFTAEEAKHDILDYIMNLPDSAFKKPADERKNAFSNKINAIDNMFDTGNYKGAIQKLLNDVREKCDGQVDGNPNNDWVTDKDAQEEICMKVDDLTAYLEYLLDNPSDGDAGETAKGASSNNKTVIKDTSPNWILPLNKNPVVQNPVVWQNPVFIPAGLQNKQSPVKNLNVSNMFNVSNGSLFNRGNHFGWGTQGLSLYRNPISMFQFNIPNLIPTYTAINPIFNYETFNYGTKSPLLFW